MLISGRGSFLGRIHSGVFVVCFCILASSVAVGQPVLSSSEVELAGVEITVSHRVAAGMPRTPDLSRPGTHSLPDQAIFTTPVPLLWGTRVVPAGEYVLSVGVDSDYEVGLQFQERAGEWSGLLPVERGDYSAPGNSLEIFLSARETSGEQCGAILIRWGALFLHGDFRAAQHRSFQVGPWRLQAFEFPAETALPPELILGHVQLLEGSPKSWQLTLLTRAGKPPRMRFEDRSYLRLLRERSSLQQSLVAARRAVRKQAQGADDGGKKDDSAASSALKEARRKVAQLEARLRSIELRLGKLTAGETTHELAAVAVPGEERVGPLRAELGSFEKQPAVVIRLQGALFRFSIPAS